MNGWIVSSYIDTAYNGDCSSYHHASYLLQVHRASSCCWYGRSCTSIPQVRTLLSRTYLSIYPSISSYTLLALSLIPLLYQRSVGSSSSSNNNSVLPPSMSDALGKGKSASTGTVYVPCTPVGRNLTSFLSIVRTVGTMCPAIALCGKE